MSQRELSLVINNLLSLSCLGLWQLSRLCLLWYRGPLFRELLSAWVFYFPLPLCPLGWGFALSRAELRERELPRDRAAAGTAWSCGGNGACT